jgi:hypothetical protein
MAAESQKLVFLKESINERLAGSNSRRYYFRKRAFYNHMLAAVLAAVTTVLLGLNIEPLKEYIRIAALILSAMTTLLSVYSAFYNDKELWVANNNAVNRFYQLLFDIQFEERGEKDLTEEQIDGFRKTYQNILDELNATWAKNRMASAKPK